MTTPLSRPTAPACWPRGVDDKELPSPPEVVASDPWFDERSGGGPDGAGGGGGFTASPTPKEGEPPPASISLTSASAWRRRRKHHIPAAHSNAAPTAPSGLALRDPKPPPPPTLAGTRLDAVAFSATKMGSAAARGAPHTAATAANRLVAEWRRPSISPFFPTG